MPQILSILHTVFDMAIVLGFLILITSLATTPPLSILACAWRCFP